MPEPVPSLDDLIPRLRARAADPERRTTVRRSAFAAQVSSLDLGGMLSLGRSIAADLARVVRANQEGSVDPAGHARALDLERAMTTPVAHDLPAPAAGAALARAEAAFGVLLPPSLRRVYAEVADGGFGPGEGLLPLAEVVGTYAELRAPGAMPRGRAWSDGLLPVVRMEPGYECVDATTGRVVAWDPEDLGERSSEAVFQRSFSEVAGSVEAWLAAWLGSRTQAEESAAMMADLMSEASQVRQAREARERVGRMTPEERAMLGLPEVGWERVVWGGLGWDEDEPTS